MSYKILCLGRNMFGDFETHYNMVYSISMHNLMDAPKREVWDIFTVEVLKYEANLGNTL